MALIASSWLSFWLVASNIHYGYLGDFTIFWLVGQNAVDWLYTDLHALPFPYPPSSLWLFEPWGAVPKMFALFVWDALSLGLFVCAARRIAPPIAIAIAILTYPAVSNLVNGQTGMIVGALLILGMTEKRPQIAGILLGIAAAIKPQSAFAAPLVLLLHKEYRTLLWAGATTFTLVALSAAVWGLTPWLHWFTALDDFRALVAERDIQTVSLWPYGLLIAPFAMFIPNRYAAVAIGGLLLSPYSMIYDLCGLTVLAVAVLLNRQITALTCATPDDHAEKVMPAFCVVHVTPSSE